MRDSTRSPNDICLRCSSKNRRGEWIWADMDPRHWELLIIERGVGEVGVFSRHGWDDTSNYYVRNASMSLVVRVLMRIITSRTSAFDGISVHRWSDGQCMIDVESLLCLSFAQSCIRV